MKRSTSRMFLVVVVVGLLLVATAAPAFAFIHVTVPAGECAASDQAGTTQQPERRSCSRTRRRTRRWVMLRELRSRILSVEISAKRSEEFLRLTEPALLRAPALLLNKNKCTRQNYHWRGPLADRGYRGFPGTPVVGYWILGLCRALRLTVAFHALSLRGVGIMRAYKLVT